VRGTKSASDARSAAHAVVDFLIRTQQNSGAAIFVGPPPPELPPLQPSKPNYQTKVDLPKDFSISPQRMRAVVERHFPAILSLHYSPKWKWGGCGARGDGTGITRSSCVCGWRAGMS
jgi:hypothetical protein